MYVLSRPMEVLLGNLCSRDILTVVWKVDVRLPGKGNSHSHGARPVHLIITMIVDSDH